MLDNSTTTPSPASAAVETSPQQDSATAQAPTPAPRSRWSWWRRSLAAAAFGLFAIPKFVWRTLIVAYIVVAVCFLTLRYVAAPQVELRRAEIAQALSGALKLKADIGVIRADWNGLRPRVHLERVRFFDTGGRLALELPRVDAALAWSSLLRWDIRLHRLEIAGADLSIRRDAQGQLFVAGIPIEQKDAGDSGFAQFVLRQHEIVIRNGRLTWQDDLRGSPPLHLNRVALRLDNSGGRHRFALAAQPPASYSAPIDVRGDLRVEDDDKPLADIANWRGALYVRLDRADLAVWQKWIDYPIQLPKGHGGIRAWLNFEGDQVAGLTADLALRDVQVRFATDLQTLDLASLSGRIKASKRDRDFSLAGERLQLATADGLKVMPSGFSLRHTAASGARPEQGELSADRLDIRVLTELAAYLPIEASLRARLDELKARGRIVSATAQWQGRLPSVERFNINAEFESLTMNPMGALPGFEGLSGIVTGNEKGGHYRLQIDKGSVNLPRVMHTARIPLDALSTEGTWSRERVAGAKTERWVVNLRKASLANADAAGEASGTWRGGAGHDNVIDLTAQLNRAQLSAVWRYIPVTVGHHVVEWLQRGLLHGSGENVRLRLAGKLSDFPFEKRPGGIFKVEGRFTNGTVDFAPGWPALDRVNGELLFQGSRMLITASTGYYKEAQVRDVKVEIPDLGDHGKQVLSVVGQASGPTRDFLSYVSDSRLGERVGGFTRDVVAQGLGQLDLRVDVPLHDSSNTRVKGAYSFTGNQLRLVPSLPVFANANGKLVFDEHEFNVAQAQALFIGAQVSAASSYEPDGSMRIDASGIVPVKGLGELITTPAWQYLSGETPAQATIRIRKQGVEVQVLSSLQGVASQLPAPFSKTAMETLPLTFAWQMARLTPENENPKQQSWKVQLGQRSTVQWIEQCGEAGKPCQFTRGAVAINDELSLPQRGLRLSGRFDRLNLDLWRPVVATMTRGGATPRAANTAAAVLAGGVWTADEVIAAGHVFNKVIARAVQQKDHWALRLDSPDIAGEVTWDGEGRGQLNARLSNLVLRQHKESNKEADKQGPDIAAANGRVVPDVIEENLPALDVIAERFNVRGMALGRLNLQAVNQAHTWRLNHISLDSEDHKFSGEGEWQRAGEGAGTRLKLSLSTENVGQLLARLGYPDAVNRGQAALKGELSWRAGPANIDYPTLSGNLRLEAAAGQFKKIDPGAGRLLGVLSLQSLPRRVTLDFRDVFSEGFAFDSIAGNLTIHNGLLSTKDLQIRGPAAKISMEGTTDIAREVHDLKVTVQPTLSETVAVGTVVAQTAVGVVNPLIGLATYVAQKILSDPIERIFSYDYSISGSWADPKVEKLRAAVAQPESGAPSQSAPVVPPTQPLR